MKPESRVRVVLVLESGPQPISGFVQCADLEQRHFWGWLDLLAILDALRPGESADEVSSDGQLRDHGSGSNVGARGELSPKSL